MLAGETVVLFSCPGGYRVAANRDGPCLKNVGHLTSAEISVTNVIQDLRFKMQDSRYRIPQHRALNTVSSGYANLVTPHKLYSSLQFE